MGEVNEDGVFLLRASADQTGYVSIVDHRLLLMVKFIVFNAFHESKRYRHTNLETHADNAGPHILEFDGL